MQFDWSLQKLKINTARTLEQNVGCFNNNKLFYARIAAEATKVTQPSALTPKEGPISEIGVTVPVAEVCFELRLTIIYIYIYI